MDKGKTIPYIMISIVSVVLFICLPNFSGIDKGLSYKIITYAAAGTENSANKVTKNENIAIIGNSPAFELKMSLNRQNDGKMFIRLDYYLNGESTSYMVDEKHMPELKGIIAKGSATAGGKQGYRVDKAYLNPKYAQVYLVVAGKPSGSLTDTSIYVCRLKVKSVSLLFSAKGKYTGISFSKDKQYAAFSCFTDGAGTKSCLQVLRCSSTAFTVKNNKISGGAGIGGSKAATSGSGYAFSSWYMGNIAVLYTGSDAKKATGSARDKITALLYDVGRNLFVNPDGSAVNPAAGGKATGEAKPDSAPVKTLKDFYSAISAGRFDAAYGIFDSSFLLNAFGLTSSKPLKKNDISLEAFTALYGNLLKAAQLQNVVTEKTQGDTSTVYFYQLYTAKDGQKVRQPLIVTMKKRSAGWKLTEVKDGSVKEKPFSQ